MELQEYDNIKFMIFNVGELNKIDFTQVLEHPTENFKSVWRIINNGILYGLEN
jgi:hypothetical protein